MKFEWLKKWRTSSGRQLLLLAPSNGKVVKVLFERFNDAADLTLSETRFMPWA